MRNPCAARQILTASLFTNSGHVHITSSHGHRSLLQNSQCPSLWSVCQNNNIPCAPCDLHVKKQFPMSTWWSACQNNTPLCTHTICMSEQCFPLCPFDPDAIFNSNSPHALGYTYVNTILTYATLVNHITLASQLWARQTTHAQKNKRSMFEVNEELYK